MRARANMDMDMDRAGARSAHRSSEPLGARTRQEDLASADLWRDAESGRLAATVEVHGIVVAHGLNWRDPADSLVRLASLLGRPVQNRSGPVIELSNSTTVPLEQRNKAAEWHQDDIHTLRPCRFTLLYGVEAPVTPPATLFADLRPAFDELPQRTRRQLVGLDVRHDPVGGRVGTAGEGRGRFGHTRGPEVRHPLVLEHPATGRPQLFGIAGTACGIVGMSDDDGVDLLRSLKRWATQPRFVQAVPVTTGSLLVWDNLALAHSATRLTYSDEEGCRRRVLRITVTDVGSEPT